MSHVPMSVAHKSVKDTTIGKYKIPKNTQVGDTKAYTGISNM